MKSVRNGGADFALGGGEGEGGGMSVPSVRDSDVNGRAGNWNWWNEVPFVERLLVVGIMMRRLL